MAKVIDFEAHFYTKSCVDYLTHKDGFPRLFSTDDDGSYSIGFNELVSMPHKKDLMSKLLDLGAGRIAEMDKNKVDVEVLSLNTPGVEYFDYGNGPVFAREINDELYESIKLFPDRLKGFATIFPDNAVLGIKELERAIKDLGFVGWLTHSNFGNDEYLDAYKYWPLLEAMESLNAPIYLHPTIPNIKEFGKYGFALAGAGFGFQFDTSLCLMRMILSGVFDQFPKLKVILGHLGETMPFLMERLDFVYRRKYFDFGREKPILKRLPSQVLCENIYVATSGRFYQPVLEYVVKAMGDDKILFATDYPLEDMGEATDFVMKSNLSPDIIAKISSENAKKLGIII